MSEVPTSPQNLRRRALDDEPHEMRRVHRVLDPRRELCSMTHIERDHPFSWVRCFVSLVSYVLFLSDVLRTGPALRATPKDLVPLEFDCVSSFGSVGYPVSHLTLANATTEAFTRYWPYKYDTTSSGFRALAQHLELQSWSPCLLYKERCDEMQGIPLRTVFTMIDELAGAVNGSGSINFRITSLFRDKLHHYAMPWFFEYTDKRTIQASRYNGLGRTINTIVCNSLKPNRPYMCAQTWANRLTNICAQSTKACRAARRTSEQILERVRLLSRFYPGKTIESIIVDSTDDYTHDGVVFPGHRRADVVLFSRVRSCVEEACSTIAVDDYRFETVQLMVNVGQWFSVVAVLRVGGQAYIWLRVFLLVWVCHAARRNASREYRSSSRLAQCRNLVRTIFLVPSQVVVYGSLLPISLYYLAHLIDSPITYILASLKFDSLFGSLTWNVGGIVHYCTVSMRTVWVLSFYCHLVQAAWTRCVWSPAFGVPGISEFVITFISSLTLLSQYRMLSWRNTSVLEISEVIPSDRVHQLRSYPRDTARSALNNLLFGTMVDWKCLLHATAAVALICAMLWILNRVFPRYFPFQVAIASRTLVPHAASYLWPRNRLVVSWFGSLLTKPSTKCRTQNSKALMVPRIRSLSAPVRPSVVPERIEMKRGLSLQGQQEVLCTARRSRKTESVIYLMNFAVMTDPITLLQLRFFSGRQVATYQSKTTRECFLLPYDERSSSADSGINWEDLRLLAVTNTKDLEWDDLLRCG